MSGMQAQCWFMVCPDCDECVESNDIHCDGAMKGQNPYIAPKDPIFCPAQTYRQTRDSPAEYCDELVSEYGDYCEKHDYTDEDAADDAREHDYESRMGY